MRWLALLALGLALVAPGLPAAGDDAEAALARARRELVDRTRDYRSSLERLLTLHEAAARGAGEVAATRRALYERGLLSRGELEASAQGEGGAQRLAAETRQRLAETDALLAETLAAIALAPAAAARDAVVTPEAVGSLAGPPLTAVAVGELEGFFAARFARPLPVSARGQTLVHERLGLDHHQALDVAVHPDSEEGRALVEYLRRHGMPFLAFRGAVPGASTGAHVHVGRASLRLGLPRAAGR
jgi:hypothetical protein